MVLKDMKVNKQQQCNLLIATFVITFLVVGLFNLFWAPLIFLVYTSWIILNKDGRLSKNELLGLIIVKTFLFYSCLARLFSQGPALFLAVPIVFISLLAYVVIWRRTR